MVWGKRRFSYADYSPYFDLMRKLRQADPTSYRQFIMISTERVGGGERLLRRRAERDIHGRIRRVRAR